MKGDCRTYREEIAAVAEGRASAEAVAHVAGCPACAGRVETYRRIFATARLPRESAPASLIASVAAMMPDRRLTFVARRLGALATARRQGGEFQIAVGDEETSVRLFARPGDGGWTVMGRFPGEGWTLEGPDATIEGDRFSFRAPTLEATAFAIESETKRLEIPALARLVEDEPGER